VVGITGGKLKRRVLVLRAGSPSGNNLIRSLQAASDDLHIAGCNDDAFTLKKSLVERNYLVPASPTPEFNRALLRVIEAEKTDLLIPNSDRDVATIAKIAHRLPCRTFLPRKSALARCQDKYDLGEFLAQRGFPVAETYAVHSLDAVGDVFRRLASHSKLWCRARRGSGSLGALPVETPEQARSWIAYWQDVRGLPEGSFTLSEYLPGRDLMVQCLFKDGTPLMTKMFERVSFHTLNAVPSGVSSTAALSKLVFERDVIRMCTDAVIAIEPRASSVFFADLKENAGGQACITEINPGRFSNMAAIHDRIGPTNMCGTYVRAAFGEQVDPVETQPDGEDYYVMRALDGVPVVLRGCELFEGLTDMR
jgi:carbamoyl-phosphate synthase large subunit